MAAPRCPICQRSLEHADANHLPFCSERCRAVDLGRWLGGEYRVPVRQAEEDEDGDAPLRRPEPR